MISTNKKYTPKLIFRNVLQLSQITYISYLLVLKLKGREFN